MGKIGKSKGKIIRMKGNKVKNVYYVKLNTCYKGKSLICL